MRVLVAEFVTAGGLPPDDVPASLATEGRAMFDAVRADFAALPESSVVEPAAGSAVGFFERLRVGLQECDAAFVVAPEFDGILERCHDVVVGEGVRWLGCDRSAIRVCGDKRILYQRLVESAVRTIPTHDSQGDVTDSGPFVLKPRDGAGSTGVRTIETREALGDAMGPGDVVQPFVAGTPASVSLIVRSDGDFDLFPTARQFIDSSTFAYLGGRIPLVLSDSAREATREVVEHLVRSIDGLRGFVGVDLIYPECEPEQPVVVEVNPRLTTSYLGHRMWTDENLAARLFGRTLPPVVWREVSVEFDPAGAPLPETCRCG